MDESQRIEDLRRELRRHDWLYYVQAQPEISDRQYDRMLAELRELEDRHPELITPDSPTQRVGGEPIEGFRTVEHALPMLSIDNTYSRDELMDFDRRVRQALGETTFHYLVDPKVDGVASSLRYERGVLTLAATRGDGRRGDDITANARAIRSIPLRLRGDDVPEILEVRGEIYWPRKTFAEYNAARAAGGLDTFANPRNGAAGTLKQLDPRVVSERKLAFAVHGLGQVRPAPWNRASQAMERLKEWGLPVNPGMQLADNVDAAWAIIEAWLHKRAQAEYETDGMVVKVDELPLRDELGQTSRAPRWCIAYKYQAEQAATVVRGVTHSVGRLGTITPIAHFDPVHLGGTTVVNASLHNYDQVRRLDVHVGDTVLVEKAGEIIPQVVQVQFDARPRDARPITPPDCCPACNETTKRDEGGVYLRCINAECPAQIRQRLGFFAGRDQMDIDNLGPAVIDQLVASGKVQHFADLYKLTAGDLKDLPKTEKLSSKGNPIKVGAKVASELVAAIDASRRRGLARVLAALGIRHVGARASELLAEHLGDMGAIAQAPVERLVQVPEIGPVIAQSVWDFFHSQSGAETIERLRAAGVDMQAPRRAAPAGPQPLAGKTVVVTGTLEGFTRQQAHEAIKSAGGAVASSVSKNTSFVVVGADAGSKADKARQLGVEMIDEAELVRRLGGK
jgi:DNA ligase (NAD+)